VSSELEIEPVPGLPHELPPGEQLLWQGRPRWKGLALSTFHLDWLAVYFGAFTLARGGLVLQEGRGIAAAFVASAVVLPLTVACLGLLALLAWLNARSTVYTLTSRRVVMRFGVAFPMTFNLPFRRIASADLLVGKGTGGDIALQLSGPARLAWFHLWPHVRPWHFKRAQPTLRAIPEAARVAGLLADAVQAWSVAESTPVLLPGRAPGAEVATAPRPVGLAPALTAQAGR